MDSDMHSVVNWCTKRQTAIYCYVINSASDQNETHGAFSAGFRLYSAPSADTIENSLGRPYGTLICEIVQDEF